MPLKVSETKYLDITIIWILKYQKGAGPLKRSNYFLKCTKSMATNGPPLLNISPEGTVSYKV